MTQEIITTSHSSSFWFVRFVNCLFVRFCRFISRKTRSGFSIDFSIDFHVGNWTINIINEAEWDLENYADRGDLDNSLGDQQNSTFQVEDVVLFRFSDIIFGISSQAPPLLLFFPRIHFENWEVRSERWIWEVYWNASEAKDETV